MTKQCSRSMLLGRLVVALVVGVVLSWFMTSCEETDDALNVFPGNSTIGPNISTFTIAVVSATRDISLPLEWSVSNPELGSITSTSGYSVVYTRTTNNGENSVTVRDQYGTEGVAAVDQVAYDTGQPATPTNVTTSTTTQ